MDADFNALLERIGGGGMEVLKVWNKTIVIDGARTLSIALMNENNKVSELNLSGNDIGDDGIIALSTALMHKNNKVTTLDLLWNNIGEEGVRAYRLH